MSARLRALLALIWWAGFYLLGLGVVGALFWVPWAEATYSRNLTFAGVIAGVLGVTVAWALRPRFNPTPARSGRSVDRSRAPALFAFVDDLARRAGTRPPAELYLTLEATAWTGLERRSFFRRGVPTLTLGLPLLTWMKQDELASVVAHEFGHHVGHDVALGPWVYRTRLAIAGVIGQLDDSAFFLDVPFRAYGKLFLRLTASLSRAQELAADALSAKIAGATAARTALRLVHERAPLWQTYLHLDVLPFLQQGLRVPVLEGYRSLPDSAGLRSAFAKLVEAQKHEEASPWDTHPTLEQRLAALPQAEAARPASQPALLLLGNVERDQETMVLETSFTGEVKELRDLSWNAAGAWLVEQYGKTLENTRLAKQTDVGALPAVLADAEGLAAQLSNGVRFMSREARRREALAWVVQWLNVRLVEQGFEPGWRPGSGLLLRGGGEEISAKDLVDALELGALTAAGWAARWAELSTKPTRPSSD